MADNSPKKEMFSDDEFCNAVEVGRQLNIRAIEASELQALTMWAKQHGRYEVVSQEASRAIEALAMRIVCRVLDEERH